MGVDTVPWTELNVSSDRESKLSTTGHPRRPSGSTVSSTCPSGDLAYSDGKDGPASVRDSDPLLGGGPSIVHVSFSRYLLFLLFPVNESESLFNNYDIYLCVVRSTRGHG